jgi:hypothetical protein
MALPKSQPSPPLAEMLAADGTLDDIISGHGLTFRRDQGSPPPPPPAPLVIERPASPIRRSSSRTSGPLPAPPRRG